MLGGMKHKVESRWPGEISILVMKHSEVSQLCPTLCNPMDCNLPGSTVHGILQARILEWLAISFSRRSLRPRDCTRVSRVVGRRFTIWATREERKEELKSLLMKMKEEIEKAGLKLNIQKMKITASGPIISWQIDGETVETVTGFIFGGSKITADGDCSHGIKRCSSEEKLWPT